MIERIGRALAWLLDAFGQLEPVRGPAGAGWLKPVAPPRDEDRLTGPPRA